MTEMSKNRYEAMATKTIAEAKAAMKTGNKKKAVVLMKKKKMYEKEISKLDGMMMFMEQQKMTMESTTQNTNVMEAMSAASGQIEEMQSAGNVDQFDSLRDQYEEQQDKQNEVHDFFNDFAESNGEDVEDELADLEEEMAAEAEMEIEGHVPSGNIAAATSSAQEISNKEEEDLLAELN